MIEHVVLVIPETLDEADWEQYIKGKVGDLYPAMDTVIGPYDDDRTEVDEPWIERVEFDESSVSITYFVPWTYYAGCRDLNDGGQEERELHGEREGNVLTFETFRMPTRQSPADEL